MKNLSPLQPKKMLYQEAADELNFSGLSRAMIAQDHQTAIRYFRKAALMKHADALYNLSIAYEYGLGVLKSPGKAIKYQLKAARYGSRLANSFFFAYFERHSSAEKIFESCSKDYEHSPLKLYHLGIFYESGLQVLADHQQAYQYYQQAAKQGFNKAQDRLGYLLENGLGVAQDLAKAFDCYRQAAQQGDGFRKAQFNLGRCYRQGIGCDVDLKLADFWLRKAMKKSCRPAIYEYIALAESGYVVAQANLGYYYSVGEIVSQDYAESHRWLQLAAQQENIVATYNLGIDFFCGLGVVQNYQKAASCFLKAAKCGLSSSQRAVGIAFRDGLGVIQDHREALFWLSKAAIQDHVGAKASIGFLYLNGKGIGKNYRAAFNWFTVAAQQGSGWGKYGLGLLFEKGLGVLQSYPKAIEWYQQAHVKDITPAQIRLGFFYATGIGTIPMGWKAVSFYEILAKKGVINALYNSAVMLQVQIQEKSMNHGYLLKALDYYQFLANSRDSDAKNNLGVLHEEGIPQGYRGVEKDYEQAVKWYKKSAEQRNGAAQFNLGRCYQMGQGVQQNDRAAFRYYRKAARQGIIPAYNNLGVFYAEGVGVSQNSCAAFDYFQKAAQRQCLEAVNNIKLLSSTERAGSFESSMKAALNPVRGFKKYPPKWQKILRLADYAASEQVEQDQF